MERTVVEQKILKAAKDTFLRYGFHGTTLQRIAIIAEVNNNLSQLNISNNTALTMLSCHYNSLT